MKSLTRFVLKITKDEKGIRGEVDCDLESSDFPGRAVKPENDGPFVISGSDLKLTVEELFNSKFDETMTKHNIPKEK